MLEIKVGVGVRLVVGVRDITLSKLPVWEVLEPGLIVERA